jgi:uncharacterized phiE125 gp8 family phage protein
VYSPRFRHFDSYRIDPIGVLKVVTPPTTPAVAAADLREQLRLSDESEDTYLSALIAAATAEIEAYLEYSGMERVLKLSFDYGFPLRYHDGCLVQAPIKLRRGPVVTLAPGDFTYIDGDGVTQTLVAGTDYTADFDRRPAHLFPAFGTSWPATRLYPNVISVQFTAGVATPEELDPAFVQAIKVVAAEYYTNRSVLPLAKLNESTLQILSIMVGHLKTVSF